MALLEINAWPIKVILINTKDKKFFDSFDYKVVGDYLCYKQRHESKIFYRRISKNQGSQDQAQSLKVSQDWTNELEVDLSKYIEVENR